MSLHELSPTRKPRRLGLYLPFVLLLVAALAWTAFWLWARAQTQARLDAAVAELSKGGYQVSWGQRTLGGYPFRMDLRLTDASVRDPSGWALQAPVLEAEAFLYSPDVIVLAAPQGLTFVRPLGGPVKVAGKVVRASLSKLDARPPSFSFQGENLVFQPAPGARPFALTSADLVEFHLRAGPDDEGGVFARVDGGKAQLGGLIGRIAADKPVTLTWNSTLSKMSAFAGANWADAVRRWSDAGGLITVRDGSKLVAGDALLDAKRSTLGVGADGRLRGVLQVSLRQAPKALGALADTGVVPYAAADAASAVTAARQDGETARVTLNFEAGQVTLGPVAIAPAPKIYTPR